MPSCPVVSLPLSWTIMNRHYATFSTRPYGVSGREVSPKKFRKSRKTLSSKRSSPRPKHLLNTVGRVLPHLKAPPDAFSTLSSLPCGTCFFRYLCCWDGWPRSRQG